MKYERFPDIEAMAQFARDIAAQHECKVYAEPGTYMEQSARRPHVFLINSETGDAIYCLRWDAFASQPDIDHYGKRAAREAFDMAEWCVNYIQDELARKAAPATTGEKPMLRNFGDCVQAAFDVMPDVQKDRAARIKAEADKSGTPCNFVRRAVRVYFNAKRRAENFGYVGVGCISFAEARLVEFQRRAQREFERYAVETGLTGPDWEPDATMKHYAQRGDVYAFGPTPWAALVALSNAEAAQDATMADA